MYLAHEWLQRSWVWDPVRQLSVFAPNFGANQETMLFTIALLLALIAIAGGTIVKVILRLTRRAKPEDGIDPRISPTPVSQQRLRRRDGSDLHVEFYGPEDGILIVLTHGWGLHGGEWNYLKRELAGDFRLVVWDEPGLGDSTRPTSRDYIIENLARSLEAVLALAADKTRHSSWPQYRGYDHLDVLPPFPIGARQPRIRFGAFAHDPYESCPHHIGLHFLHRN